MGQQAHLVGAPNRYGLDPFYELHVWALRPNVKGTFVDWNPAVSCAGFVAEETPDGHRPPARPALGRAFPPRGHSSERLPLAWSTRKR